MLRVHTSDRLLPLADDLAQLLGSTPSDAMTPEWIATPSAAMRRWLSLQLARRLGVTQGSAEGGPDSVHDGVSANIESAFPGSLLARVFDADSVGRTVTAPRPPPGTSPDHHSWEVESLTWATLRVIDQHADDKLLKQLASPGADTEPSGSRYARVRRIADLFDRYNLHRPTMIRQWAQGADTDGSGQPLPERHLWQPHLWRLLRQQIGTASPAERLPEILAGLTSGELRLDLPDRLVLFGLTVVPGGPEFMELARAVGTHHELHLYFLEPSPTAADAIRMACLNGSNESAGDTVAHPLLKSWGRPSTDTAQILATAERDLEVSLQQHRSQPGSNTTMLERLQSDIRTDCLPAGDHFPDPADRSVQLHACYGPQRQVEALRDSILHLLASDPTLSEDDIIVLTPSLERFAPLIDAIFGPSTDDPESGHPTTLRYRIADRSILSSYPVLAATSQLLDIATGRFEAATVIEFLGLTPVRERFGFTSEEISTIAAWVDSTNVRWGLNPQHRQRHGIPASIDTNTWESAVDRLLLGSTIVDDQPALSIGDVSPEGIEGSDTDLAGRLAEVIHHLSWLSGETTSTRPINEWLGILLEASRALIAAPPSQQWQADALREIIADINDTSELFHGPSTSMLTFDDLRHVVGGHMAGKSGRPDFFRGGITVSSLQPLRWLPHRVICLLGLDQSASGQRQENGDDLVAAAPLLGDHHPRDEARQVLLEAVLSADDHLLIFRDGHNISTNEAIPAPTVVDELLDTLTAAVSAEQRHEFRAAIELEHPRQSFDDRYFTEGSLIRGTVVGFEPDAFHGAQSRRARRRGQSSNAEGESVGSGGSAITGGGPGESPTVTEHGVVEMIQLTELHNFLRNPTKHFTDHQLQIRLPRASEEPSSTLPLDIGGLDRWQLGELMIRSALSNPDQSVDESIRNAVSIERRKGSIPPAGLGDRQVDLIGGGVDEVIGAALTLGVTRQPAGEHPVDITLVDGTRIVGTVSLRLAGASPGPAQITYSTWKPTHLVKVWLDLMCLVASDSSTDWCAVTISPVKAGDVKGAEAWKIAPAGDSPAGRADVARVALGIVVDCIRRGTREPIPLFPVVSKGLYVDGLPGSQLASPGTLQRRFDLTKAWFESRDGRGDRSAPEVELFYGDLTIDDLRQIEALDNDPAGPGGRADRFADYLWGTIDESIQLTSFDGDSE